MGAKRGAGERKIQLVESERNLIPARIAMRAILLLVILSLTTGAFAREGASPASSVNAMIGTGQGPGGSQNLFPGATLPFGMVQLSPDTEDHGFGYHYYQDEIQGFSMTHMSGVGCPNEGDVFFTATTGPVGTQVADFESPYSHDQESATPGYYQVRLSRWDVNAELTATDRTGLARFTFPAGKPGNILVPISHTLNQTMGAHVRVVGNNRIEGYVEDQAFCGVKHNYKVYFVMTFSKPFASFGTWTGQKASEKKGESQPETPAKISEGNRAEMQTRDSQWIGAYASWSTASEAQTITAKVGISYVDLAGAENNLKKEASGKDFSKVQKQAAEVWNKALSAIDVSGGTPAERTVFYTGLYHSLMMPSIFSDADGRYLGFDQKIHTVAAGHLLYGNYSGWDIYRSEMPLLALITPRRAEDMAESIVLMYKQGGWIDRWPQINLYTNVMAGSPLTTVVATTWLDGLHGFDMDTAWEGMWKDATEAPPAGKPYQGQEGIDWINRIHYVPNDKVKYGSVSQLQEDGAAYASLYYLAKNLGKTDAAKTLYERALYYRNVFDPQDQFFRPRNADGQWVEPFDPSQEEHGFIEGSGWHYQWFAPWDMAWLIHAVGPEQFNQRLSTFFDYKKPGWYGQYYNPYNETDLEAPFEFNFSGQPWMSQRVVRRILSENYPDAPDGIPGNDDCGAMSSWAVMSMMGFYSVDPASLAYELVSPVFSKVTIHLQAPYTGKTFTIEASPHPDATPYIQGMQLDGKAYARNWIPFRDMTRGSKLSFVLGAEPNRSWGVKAEDLPPSLSQTRP